MREIKFRAWDEVTKIMHYPASDMMWDVAHIIKSYEPIMQYTGLKDKNGKEIYEGDIVDVCVFLVSPSNPDNDQHFRGKVIFENGSFNLWIYQYRDFSYNNGNIVPLKANHMPFECELDEDGGVTVNLYDFMCISGNMGEWVDENIEVVGNSIENPELLTPPPHTGVRN